MTAPISRTPDNRARLLVHGTAIPRPYPEPSSGGPVRTIRPTPVNQAVQAIWECLWSGEPFCVTGGPAIDDDENPWIIHSQSSGSTGDPKRIRRSMASWRRNFKQNAQLFDLTHSDKSAILGGLENSISLYALTEALFLGMTVNVLSGLKRSEQIAGLNGVTMLYATPTQIRATFASALPALRNVVVGGGHLDDKTRALIAAHAPNARVHEFYGAAETSFVTVSDGSTPAGSVGAPYPNVQIDIRKPDENGVGEIWIKSPYLFDGYANGVTGQTRTDGDWITVGELGYVIDSHLYLVGRSDRMFTVADRNYYPEQIEAKLAAMDGVEYLSILPQSDPMRGNRPIILFSGSATPDDIQTLARNTAGNDAPRKAFRLSSFPLTSSGKPDIAALRGIVDRL